MNGYKIIFLILLFYLVGHSIQGAALTVKPDKKSGYYSNVLNQDLNPAFHLKSDFISCCNEIRGISSSNQFLNLNEELNFEISSKKSQVISYNMFKDYRHVDADLVSGRRLERKQYCSDIPTLISSLLI